MHKVQNRHFLDVLFNISIFILSFTNLRDKFLTKGPYAIDVNSTLTFKK